MDFQPSDPYFSKASPMLHAINSFPVGGSLSVGAPTILPPEPVPSNTMQTTEQPSILTPRNIMIGAGVICVFIVIAKSK